MNDERITIRKNVLAMFLPIGGCIVIVIACILSFASRLTARFAAVESANRLRQSGVKVDFAHDLLGEYPDGAWSKSNDECLEDSDVRDLERLYSLRFLRIRGRADRQIVCVVPRFAKLEDLALTEMPLTDDDIALFTSLPRLKRLDVSRTEVSDRGMKSIAKMPQITYVTLDDLPISDMGIQVLLECPHLRGLSLEGTAITDDSIHAICMMTQLESLNIRRTKISSAGIHQLRERTPDLMIDRP